MKLILLLGIPYLRKHKLRTVLTVTGIVLGVALFLGMHSGNQTVLAAFRQTVNRVAGSTELQVTAAETGFPEEVLEKIQAHPDVRVAVPVIEASVASGLPGQGNLLILGVDMTGDQSLRDYDLQGKDEDAVEDPLVFLAQPDSLIVSRQFAERNRFGIGQRIALGTMEGEKQFVIRGIMRAGGLASAYGGSLAVMDVYAAQLVFGRGRSFDRVDIAVREGVPVARVQAELEKLLGPGLQVETPESRGKYLESVSAALTLSVNLTSALSLLIGVFIIYNAFSIAVTQRQSEIGILRALGATRKQVLTLFVGESIVLGVIGSALGIVFGRLLARGVAQFMSQMVEQMYTTNQTVDGLVDDPQLLAWTFALGVLASVVGGVLPARRAARVDPVLALQKGRQQVLTAGENRARRLAAIGVLAAAIALLVAGSKPAFFASYLLLIAAALLMTPSVAMWLTRALRPAWKRARQVEGSLAADSLVQAPRRTSATVAALMLSLALAVSFAGIALSSNESLFAWMRATMNFDLIVTTSENISARSFRFPPEVATAVAGVEGVEEAQPVRFGRTVVRGRPVMLVAAEIARISGRIRPRVIEGSLEEMVRLGSEGRGALISDNFALIENLHLGDMIEIPAPDGMLRLPVVGVTIDYTDQRGSILIDRSVYLRHWKDETINVVRVYLKPGASPAEVRERILRSVGTGRSLFVMTSAELRDYVGTVANQWFAMTYLQLIVAVLIAMLGIINSLTVSIIDRRRELGVLQAVGGLRRQVRHAVWMEALLVGTIGVVLGIALGAVMLYYNFVLVKMDVVGIRLEYAFPVAIALLLFPVILGAAFVASLWPAEAAVRASLVEALEYE